MKSSLPVGDDGLLCIFVLDRFYGVYAKALYLFVSCETIQCTRKSVQWRQEEKIIIIIKNALASLLISIMRADIKIHTIYIWMYVWSAICRTLCPYVLFFFLRECMRLNCLAFRYLFIFLLFKLNIILIQFCASLLNI